MDQYCFLLPVEVEEWYHEECPECTGEGHLPKEAPDQSKTTDMDQIQDFKPAHDMWEELHNDRECIRTVENPHGLHLQSL